MGGVRRHADARAQDTAGGRFLVRADASSLVRLGQADE